MRILSIETSCDETAVSIIEAEGGTESPTFKILGNALFSQVNTHREYGGVYPMLAKREHIKNLPPLLDNVLKQAGVNKTKKPDIDVIGVTSGPGLEPALWVGISFAENLAKLWGIPVVPINHMEGHVLSVLIENSDIKKVEFPALALLISGGHTELVSMKGWGKYEVIGETLDDAVGEAFDKVARMMGLPYPGGPEISKLAEKARENKLPAVAKLPRPMIHSDNLNFSFSGLKTAVLYYIRDNFGRPTSKTEIEGNKVLTTTAKADLAREFEDSVVDVLLHKTNKALEETGAKTLIVAGGVIANKKIRQVFTELIENNPDLVLKIPTNSLATDNSLMIAVATYFNVTLQPEILDRQIKIIANGNLRL